MPEEETLERRRFLLLFGVQRSIRYHARRRSHFDQLNRMTVLISLLFGSATFAALLGKLGGDAAVLWFAGVVTVASAIDLVLGSSVRARGHHDFERRWTALEQELVRVGEYDDARLREFLEKRLSIEADEEPALRVLNIMCHNELTRAIGSNGPFYKVGWLRRALSQWYDLQPDSIKERPAQDSQIPRAPSGVSTPEPG